MALKVGSFVYSTDQGLGILARAFYDHGVVTDVLMIRHSSRHNHPEWYPNSEMLSDINRIGVMIDFISRMDVMLFFETPFNWEIINQCRLRGVKTVMMPMYECMPTVLPAQPDMFLNPSLLDQSYYPTGTHIPVPVEVPWKIREKALTFIHNAGHGGLRGRNGTAELLQAIPLVSNTDTKFIIRTQDDLRMPTGLAKQLAELATQDRFDIRLGNASYGELWSEGDVFVFPEKFNGLSLPIQEAYASGMMVMATNRFPNNSYLPNDCLIPVASIKESCVSGRCNRFDEAIVSPQDIVTTIETWAGQDITTHSVTGGSWAKSNSWEILKTKYMELLQS